MSAAQPTPQLEAAIDSVRVALRAFVKGYLQSCGKVFESNPALARFADVFHKCKVPQRWLHVLANLHSISLLQRGPDKGQYAALATLRAAVSSLDSKHNKNLIRAVLTRFDAYGVTRTTDQRLRLLTHEGMLMAREVVLPWFDLLEHLRRDSGIDDWREAGRLLWKLRGSRSPHPEDRPRLGSLDDRTPTIATEHYIDLEEDLTLIRRPSNDAEILIFTMLLPALQPARLDSEEQQRLASDLERFRIGLTTAPAREILNGNVEFAKRRATQRQQLAAARTILGDLRQGLLTRYSDAPETELALNALDAAIESLAAGE